MGALFAAHDYSHECGSGGRELGRRLAETRQMAYVDRKRQENLCDMEPLPASFSQAYPNKIYIRGHKCPSKKITQILHRFHVVVVDAFTACKVR